MNIKIEAMNQILSPLGLQGSDIAVSLFIVSKRAPRLKRLDLGELSSDEKVTKLRKWAQDNRFVAVVERGEVAYALASPQFAESLQNQPDLSINGKKVAVKALTETEVERLSSIGEAFEECLKVSPEEELQEESEDRSKEQQEAVSRQQLREYLARAALLSDAIKMDYLILQMQNIPEKIKLAFLRKMQEMNRLIERRKKEDDLREEARNADIRRDDLRSRVRKEDIVKEEVKGQSAKLEQVTRAARKRSVKEEVPAISPVAKKKRRP